MAYVMCTYSVYFGFYSSVIVLGAAMLWLSIN